MEPYPDLSRIAYAFSGVYLARDGALPRRDDEHGVVLASLSSEGWSPTPTGAWRRRTASESI